MKYKFIGRSGPADPFEGWYRHMSWFLVGYWVWVWVFNFFGIWVLVLVWVVSELARNFEKAS
jgi:hypothetical protein